MIARIRNTCTFTIHRFFQNNGYVNVHIPLIISNYCEGVGETFNVTLDSGSDFLQKSILTISGQLHGE